MATPPIGVRVPAASATPDRWKEVGGLPCELSVELAVPAFQVRTMLQLAAGAIVRTEWKLGEDLPLLANGRQIGWVELEALGESLAIRLTELV